MLLYAPAESRPQFEELLESEGLKCMQSYNDPRSPELHHSWSLEPQIGGLAVCLTDKLKAALVWAKDNHPEKSIFFIGLPNILLFICLRWQKGMDTPDLPVETIANAAAATAQGHSFIKPATDGGYVLLGLPKDTPETVFDNIRWYIIRSRHVLI